MKIIILSYTGNVGKTVITRHLLAPRMMDIPVIAVESINENAAELGLSIEQFKADNAWELFSKLLTLDDVIVDVGASNIVVFLQAMNRFNNAQDKFDYFIIPVTSGTKEQRETISIISKLQNMGVSPEKIRLFFNRVNSSVEVDFHILLKYVAENKNAIVNTQAAIYENELFDELAIKKMSINQLLSDPKNYRQLLRENKDADQKQRAHWGDMFGLKALAKSVNRNLDEAFAALFM